MKLRERKKTLLEFCRQQVECRSVVNQLIVLQWLQHPFIDYERARAFNTQSANHRSFQLVHHKFCERFLLSIAHNVGRARVYVLLCIFLFVCMRGCVYMLYVQLVIMLADMNIICWMMCCYFLFEVIRRDFHLQKHCILIMISSKFISFWSELMHVCQRFSFIFLFALFFIFELQSTIISRTQNMHSFPIFNWRLISFLFLANYFIVFNHFYFPVECFAIHQTHSFFILAMKELINHIDLDEHFLGFFHWMLYLRHVYADENLS